MKKLLITIAIAIVGASSHAQWIVYDPTVNIEQIISEAENIAECVGDARGAHGLSRGNDRQMESSPQYAGECSGRAGGRHH